MKIKFTIILLALFLRNIVLANCTTAGNQQVNFYNASGGSLSFVGVDYVDCNNSDRGTPNDFGWGGSLAPGGTAWMTFSASGGGWTGTFTFTYRDSEGNLHTASASCPGGGNVANVTLNGSSNNGPTTTNVTVTLQNNSGGYADLVWYFNGAPQKDDQKTCPGTVDSAAATIRLDSNGQWLDTFNGSVIGDSPSLTNRSITLVNPSGTSVIMDFNWIFNGNYIYTDHNMMPGASDTKSANVNLCAGDTFTGQTSIDGPAYTNVTGTVSNPFTDKTVLAYWTLNGQPVKQETLLPGQSDSVTEQIPMGGANTTFAWGYTINGDFGGNNDDPFGTNNTGLSFSNNPTGGTGGFGSTGGGGTTGSTGGGTGTSGTVGGSTPTGTNAPIWTGAIFTNNIIYPDAPGGGDGTDTKGLALDSTLRAVGGTLHNDNLETLKGLGIIDKDVQSVTTAILGKGTNVVTVNVPANSNVWVQNFPDLGPITNMLSSIGTYTLGTQTEMGVMTNEAGQQVSYLAVLTNDVWQIVKELTNQPAFTDTNGYLGGLYTNSIDLNTKFGTFTNDSGQLVAYQAVLTNDLWMITQELTNMAGTLTQQVIANFPTNITFTVNQASNVNVLNWPSNYATEGTLQGVSNLLAGAFAPTNGAFSLDTNFPGGASNYDLSGYTVSYDGPTNFSGATALSGQQASASGLSDQENGFDALVTSITDFSPGIPGTYPSVPMVVDFSAYGVPGGTMDLDPLHTAWGADLFTLAKKLFTWLIAFSFLIKVTDEAWKAVMVITGAHGINPGAVRTTVKNT